MDQKIEPLRPEHEAELEAKRSWVRGHLDEGNRHRYESLDGKLALLDTILLSGWASKDETLKLQCLGVTFGDALAQEMGMEWVTVTDEYGSDPALSLPGTSIFLFPMTSISKRVERGEEVLATRLFKEACETVNRLSAEGA